MCYHYVLQVPKNGTFLSCCALLKGCQRTLFFVPKEGEIADGDGTLSRLEEEAAADPTKRVALLQQVHVRSAKKHYPYPPGHFLQALKAF